MPLSTQVVAPEHEKTINAGVGGQNTVYLLFLSSPSRRLPDFFVPRQVFPLNISLDLYNKLPLLPNLKFCGGTEYRLIIDQHKSFNKFSLVGGSSLNQYEAVVLGRNSGDFYDSIVGCCNVNMQSPLGPFLKVPQFCGVFRLGNKKEKGLRPLGNKGGNRICLLLQISGGFATL